MKFFGKSSSVLKIQKIKEVKCPNCGRQNQVDVQGITRKFYVLWIPFFTLGREFYIVCIHCRGVYNKYNMEIEEYRKIDREVRHRLKSRKQ